MWCEAEELPQPQDGAAMRALAAELSVPSLRNAFGRFREPEDARLTGGTRSLGRRLLGLNVIDRIKPAAREITTAPNGFSLPKIA